MTRIKRWHKRDYMSNSFYYDYPPCDFPILSKLFNTETSKHFQNLDDFNIAVIILSNKIVNADRVRSKEEILFIRKFYGRTFPPKKIMSVMYLLETYNKRLSKESYLMLYNDLNELLEPELKKHLVFFLFELSNADGKISNSEIAEIIQICKHLNFSEKAINRLTALYIADYVPYPSPDDKNSKMYGTQKKFKKQTNKKKAKKKKQRTYTRSRASYSSSKLVLSLQILGLNKNSTVSQIKSAYKKLVKENHPDRFVRLGEFHVKKATEIITKINVAYDYIKRIKRFT